MHMHLLSFRGISQGPTQGKVTLVKRLLVGASLGVLSVGCGAWRATAPLPTDTASGRTEVPDNVAESATRPTEHVFILVFSEARAAGIRVALADSDSFVLPASTTPGALDVIVVSDAEEADRIRAAVQDNEAMLAATGGGVSVFDARGE